MRILCVEWGCGGRVWRWGREGNYRWNVSYYKVLNNFTCWVLFCGEQQLMILPLVSRVTGSEYSPATALLQARTLKFMYFESNFKPEKNERKPWDMKSKGLLQKYEYEPSNRLFSLLGTIFLLRKSTNLC